MSGKFLFDAGTAASTTLILQSIMPITAFSNGDTWVEVHGGTNNPWAPPIDHLQEILLPTLKRSGLKAFVELVRRGFYPQGGGVVKAWIEPIKSLKPLTLVEFGSLRRIHGVSYSSKLPCHIVQRMSKSANRTLCNSAKQGNHRSRNLPQCRRMTARAFALAQRG